MIQKKKTELRKRIAQQKTEYCDSTLKAWSADVFGQIEAHPAFRKAHVILLYYSMKDEVYTHSFIDKWSHEKEILLPVVTDGDLELRPYSSPDCLVTGAYGIREPSGRAFTDYPSIDLIIVPGVAFDRTGIRLGRGKGYYDRLLTQTRGYKIGVCFPFQLVEEVPTEKFDIGMDEVISCSGNEGREE